MMKRTCCITDSDGIAHLPGRWLSRDPIGEAGGLNLYGFTRNDGVNYIDLLGEAVFIDKNKKACKIKVSVRIYVSTKDPFNVNLSAIVPRIKNSIESQWNAGNWVLDGWTVTFDATVGTKPPVRSPKDRGAPPPGDEIEITNDPPGESNATQGGIGHGTERYLRLTITDLKEAHAKFHPRERSPQ